MKKHYFLMTLSIFLLGILIVAQTVPVPSVLKAETNSSGESNSNKYFDSAGKELSPVEIANIQKLLSSIKKTERFVVYANKIDRTNHIEGNVFVNEVEASTNLVITRVSEKQADDYSYVGKSTVPIQLSDGGKIVLGSDINVNKPNKNQTVINGGYSNNISVVQLSDDDTSQKEKLIKDTLNEISQAGENAKGKIDTSFFDNSKNSFESVNAMLKNVTSTSGSAITSTTGSAIKTFDGGVININVDYKQILNNEGAFSNLINNNHGTRIIVNVIFSDAVPNDINIMKAFSSNTKVNTDFNKLSPYIIWNFGNYSGNITISEEMLGIIVAPKATVYQAAGNLNGQIIADVAGNNGELHQVTVTPGIPDVPDKPKPSEEPEKPSETEETQKPSEEPEKPSETEETQKPSEEPEKPSETEETQKPSEEPEKPGKPDTPSTPVTPPEKPSEPQKPTTPTVPSTPTIPEQPNVTEDSEIVETQKEKFNTEKIKKETKKKTKKVDNSKKVRIDKKWYAPKTCDNSIILIYIAIVLAVLCTIFAILSYFKKKK